MAQKVTTTMLCDIHNDDTEATSTSSFTLNHAAYEIDLCQKHTELLVKNLGAFTGAARKAVPVRAARKYAPAKSNGEAGLVRVWAAENGLTVPARGRVPSLIVSAYAAAHKVSA